VAGLTLNLEFARVVGLANRMGAWIASNNAPNVALPDDLLNFDIADI
jgi:hypothetical protein